MAEGATPLSGSTAQGSADIFPHECGSCKYDWTVGVGVVFCVVCEEFLCHNGLNVHKKRKSSRSHKLLEGDDMHMACHVGLVLMGDVKDKKATMIEGYDVKFDDDWELPYITAFKFIPTGGLLMCDYYNKRIKLMNEEMFAQYSIKLPGKPWDVAVTGYKEAVVTLPHKHKLQFLTYQAEALMLGRVVDIGRQCWGIACSKDKLYTICHDNPGSAEVLILNKQGEIQTRISYGRCREPHYIALDAQGRIYLSDYGRNSVICINSAGKAEYIYTDKDLSKPGHLLVDSDQYVYVCGRKSNNVQVITDKGHKYKTLLTAEDGIVYAWTIAYRWRDGEMTLGQNVNDTMLTFRFS